MRTSPSDSDNDLNECTGCCHEYTGYGNLRGDRSERCLLNPGVYIAVNMTVFIRNMQRVVKLNTAQLKKNLNLIVSCTEYEGFDIGLMLVNDEDMRKMNLQYRGMDEVTDVLAFPYHEILSDNAGIIPEVHPEERTLGDIIFGMPYIASDCSRRAEDLHTSLLVNIFSFLIFFLQSAFTIGNNIRS
ncbi:endoribonuclease YbeY [Elysia marginata]|uniref:Endoribonuclease YbeY n=1 Tax=Elysia marginata TaxID=1093978 RepID=A0AAV4EJN8_9GAST|nr:endoribonuclease YbeY [Elysia marginata]